MTGRIHRTPIQIAYSLWLGQFQRACKIAPSVSRCQHREGLAIIQSLLRRFPISLDDKLRGHDKGHRQSRINMHFHVTVPQLHAWVICAKPHHGLRLVLQHERVTTNGNSADVACVDAIEVAVLRIWTIQNLKSVAV